jgi:hypothetical protein
LTQPDSETTRPTFSWDEQLVLFAVGICMGGFLFSGLLHTYLSAPNRPLIPEPTLGYVYLFKARHGYVYGTFFEYLAVTYGVWVMWGTGALGGLFYFNLKNMNRPGWWRAYPRHPWQIIAATAISMPLYYAIWRVSIYVARS